MTDLDHDLFHIVDKHTTFDLEDGPVFITTENVDVLRVYEVNSSNLQIED